MCQKAVHWAVCYSVCCLVYCIKQLAIENAAKLLLMEEEKSVYEYE